MSRVPGCYGHNGADDVALDAALLARAVPGRPVKVQWMRDDEFAWEPFGSAMVMGLRAGLAADGSIVDWEHELWSNGHSTRPGRPGELQPSRRLVPGRTIHPGPGPGRLAARRRRGPQCRAALRLSEPEDRQAPRPGDAAAHLGAPHPRGLRQRVRPRILHGRGGSGGRSRSGRVPAPAPARTRAAGP